MAFDTTKETMVSFLVPSQILETINDIRDSEGNPSRSSIIRRLLNRGLKSYYDNDTQQRHPNPLNMIQEYQGSNEAKTKNFWELIGVLRVCHKNPKRVTNVLQ